MSHEKPVEPFSDLHREGDRVRAVLLHDPTVEGLDMAIYMDGSASMQAEYQPQQAPQGFLDWLFGTEPKTLPNQVEPQVQWMLEYLASKDRNGVLRVAYWACGGSGREIEVVGDLQGKDVRQYQFPGPRRMGNGTHLEPAMRDYIQYLRGQAAQGAKQGCVVFVTDGELHDSAAVKTLSEQIARGISEGNLPRMNFILVGVGEGVNEEQMEDICHEEYAGIGHLWCHRIAGEIGQVAELVAILVDESMTVASGGTIYDDRGNVLKIYETRLPAVLEFDVPEGARSFTLEINGQRFTQPLPEEEEHH